LQLKETQEKAIKKQKRATKKTIQQQQTNALVIVTTHKKTISCRHCYAIPTTSNNGVD